jgi:hypothetical protein
MSERERRWTRIDGDVFSYLDGRMRRCFSGESHFGATCFTLEDMKEYGYSETYDHIPQEERPMPTAPIDPQAELQTLRTFHATVMQATQDTPNHRLCEAIFAADKAVRLVGNTNEANPCG